MKISGGLAKGRHVVTKRVISKALKDRELRPTSSKVREAIFDILRGRIVGASFVDLYAGTGTVGFEALSRGAGKAIFVEPNRLRAEGIKENAIKLGFFDKAKIVQKRAHEFLRIYSRDKKAFDIFFLDPPYFSKDIKVTLPIIGEKEILNKGGMVIIEHYFKNKLPDMVGELKMIRNYRYGDTMLTIYSKEEKVGRSNEKDSNLSRDV